MYAFCVRYISNKNHYLSLLSAYQQHQPSIVSILSNFISAAEEEEDKRCIKRKKAKSKSKATIFLDRAANWKLFFIQNQNLFSAERTHPSLLGAAEPTVSEKYPVNWLGISSLRLLSSINNSQAFKSPINGKFYPDQFFSHSISHYSMPKIGYNLNTKKTSIPADLPCKTSRTSPRWIWKS